MTDTASRGPFSPRINAVVGFVLPYMDLVIPRIHSFQPDGSNVFVSGEGMACLGELKPPIGIE